MRGVICVPAEDVWFLAAAFVLHAAWAVVGIWWLYRPDKTMEKEGVANGG